MDLDNVAVLPWDVGFDRRVVRHDHLVFAVVFVTAFVKTDEAFDDEESAAATRAKGELVQAARKASDYMGKAVEVGVLKGLLTIVSLGWKTMLDGMLAEAVARVYRQWRPVEEV